MDHRHYSFFLAVTDGAKLPDGQAPIVAFAVLAQLCGPKANATEVGAALFFKNAEGRNFNFDR